MENSVVFAKKKFTMDKFVTQAKVTAVTPIKKVLSVSARSAISSSECENGVATVGGKVFVNVVYLSAENVVSRASTEVEFIEKQQTNYSLEELFVKDYAVVESQNSTSTEIMVSVAHSVTVSGIYKYALSNFAEESKELVLNKSRFNAMKLTAVASDSFVVAEESESNIKNMTILQADAKVVLTEAVCTLDKVVVEGKILTEVFEYDGESYGLISKEFDFKQEILSEGTVPNMTADAELIVKNITVTPEETEEKTNLVFAFEVYAKTYAYEEYSYEVADDMFSLTSNITTKNSYIEAKNYHSASTISEQLTISADVSKIENFDDIAGVYGSNVTLVSAEDNGDKVDGKGLICATALLKVGEDLQVLKIENEFSFELAKEPELIFDGVDANVEILSYKVKAGKELEISAKLTYTSKFNTLVSKCFVESYEVVSNKSANVGGVKVYITNEAETLFEVAKALSVPPEVITKQNEVSDVFEKGEKIYIYSPINLI